jgi:hypothetical protein
MPWCAHCCGTGTLDCLCGGDLYICERNGEYECPFCYGGYDDPFGDFADDSENDEPVTP